MIKRRECAINITVNDIQEPFRFFVNEGLILGGKAFRLVWLLEDHGIYVGVINAHRR